MGNLHSVQRAFERLGAVVVPIERPESIEPAAPTALVLPGVGAFDPAMELLERSGLIPAIREWCAAGRPCWASASGCSSCSRAARRASDPAWLCCAVRCGPCRACRATRSPTWDGRRCCRARRAPCCRPGCPASGCISCIPLPPSRATPAASPPGFRRRARHRCGVAGADRRLPVPPGEIPVRWGKRCWSGGSTGWPTGNPEAGGWRCRWAGRRPPPVQPGGQRRPPTPSRVRQAVMNLLAADLAGCHWLDLFSGSGVMGCEALQRGAPGCGGGAGPTPLPVIREPGGGGRTIGGESLAAGLGAEPGHDRGGSAAVGRRCRGDHLAGQGRQRPALRSDLCRSPLPPAGYGPWPEVRQGGWLARRGLCCGSARPTPCPRCRRGGAAAINAATAAPRLCCWSPIHRCTSAGMSAVEADPQPAAEP